MTRLKLRSTSLVHNDTSGEFSVGFRYVMQLLRQYVAAGTLAFEKNNIGTENWNQSTSSKLRA